MDSTSDEDRDEVSALVHPTTAAKRSHRRVKSIGVGGRLELAKISTDQKVEILETELQRQSKALEEAQEETQLAARIGQSLLLQNQKLDYEWESKLATMTKQHSDDTARLQVLERDLATLQHDYNALRSARLHADAELDHLRIENADLKCKAKTNIDDLCRLQQRYQKLQQQYRELQATHEALQSDHATVSSTAQRALHDLKSAREAAQLAAKVHDARSQQLSHLTAEANNARALRDKIASLEHRHALQADAVLSLTEENSALRERVVLTTDQILTLTNERHIMAERLAHERNVSEGLMQKYEEYLQRSPVSPRSPRDGFFASGSPWKQRSLFHELSVHLRHECKPPTMHWTEWLLAHSKAGLARLWMVPSPASLWRAPPYPLWKATAALIVDWRLYWIALTSWAWLPWYGLQRSLEAYVDRHKARRA
ncbi:hypothetical protein SDRG_10061 [Saprolegnia diclina VS20]|uniref:Uncharacterized protein n=1 Tax=Saprolegnia diclina (strain VS20) TaxID=1156394 RepID=T0Q387_SAPDV|nr:hypothetical protein SDRG_10061 [Saprolegnia diclina VS20]EQC32314.1 hypothetical protein SDRG_10061 [Saprolegnia diclina VS20]|eukprot:XP_008614255.1 hypothetical protein SDRG_10061 [Saprolegnia diclina VS20]